LVCGMAVDREGGQRGEEGTSL